MSAAATGIRLALFAVLSAGLFRAALAVVPGTDIQVQTRSFVFVFAAPWLAALLVVHPARLVRALAALLSGRGDEGLRTARTLDLVAGLTMAVGAIGLIGSFITFHELLCAAEGTLELDRDRQVPGVVFAVAVPAAFALIARFVLYEPLIVALRRWHTAEGEESEGRPRVHTALKVIFIVAVTVLAVEGFRALALRPAEEAPRDTSFVVVGKDPTTGKQSPDLGPGAPSTATPIRVELVREASGVICRVDGKTLTALPGPTDELRQRVRALATDGTSRRVEIEAGPKVPFLHLVVAVDACIRATTPRKPYYATGDEDEDEDEEDEERVRPARKIPPVARRVRVLIPTARAPAVPLELRFIHERYEEQHLVLMDLPWVEQVETVTVDVEGAPPAINAVSDSESGRSEILVRRNRMNLDELKAWAKKVADARRDRVTGVSEVELLLRCDRHTPVGEVFQILALLASAECKVRHVLVAGRERWDRER